MIFRSHFMQPRSNFWQRGVSLTGLIFVFIIIGLVAVVAMKLVPTVIEYKAVKNAIVSARAAGSTPAAIRASFDKQVAVGNIESISGKDLEIFAEGGTTVVSFAYEKKVGLVGPVSLLIEYEGSTSPTIKPKKK
jgi:Domain of unknown function (DUF4845)